MVDKYKAQKRSTRSNFDKEGVKKMDDPTSKAPDSVKNEVCLHGGTSIEPWLRIDMGIKQWQSIRLAI